MRTLLFALVAFFFCGYQGIAQLSRSSLVSPKGVSTIKGDYYFDHKNYVIAINHYSKCVKQNPKDTYAMLRMAESYHKIRKDDLASQWYNKAFAINPDVEDEHILKYILLVNTLGKHGEVKRWISIYNDRITKNHANSGQALYNDSAVFILNHPVSLNSAKSDSGPFLYNDVLIFSSDLGSTGNGGYKLYKSVLNPEREFRDVMPFHETISSGPNHSAIAIATAPPTLFFTQTSEPAADGAAVMQISYCNVPANPSDAVKINKLAFKNFNHSMGHPAVNSKGTVMFFAASSTKHTRGFDLYKSEYNGKKWSAPVALSTEVNTHGDEMYPTLHNDSILYFASNVHGGLGGFDIYKVNILDKNLRVEHLKSPVNSPFNDFGMVMNNSGREGYLSSNRPGGLGADDLYKVYILPVKTIKHTAHENPSKHEELFIYTSKGDEIKLSESNKGNLKFDFTPGRRYNLTVEYDNFKTGPINTTNNATPLPKLNIYTFDIQKSLETHAHKSKTAPIQNIHINPGDLVTFQLIPVLTTDSWADNGKVQFHNAETIIGDRESIVFSYVAAGGPPISEIEDTPIADLSALDTVLSTQPVVAKEIQDMPGKIPTLQSSKAVETATQNEPMNIAAASNVNGNSSAAPAATKSVVNTPAIIEERSVADIGKTNLVSTTTPAEIIPKPKINVSDSLNSQNVVPKKNETNDPSHLSIGNTTLQDQIVSANDKNVVLNTVGETAARTVTQNKPAERIAHVVDDKRSRDSLASENFASKNITINPAQLPPDNATALLNHSISNDGKSTDLGATNVVEASESAETNLASVGHQTTMSLNNSSVVVKNSHAEDTAPLSPIHTIAENNHVDHNKATNQDAKTTRSDENVKHGPEAGNEVTDISKPSDAMNEGIGKQDEISILSPSTFNTEHNLPHVTAENSDFQYRVQIAASRSELSDAQLKKIYTGANEIFVFKEDGYFKYYIAQMPNYTAARQVLNESGVNEAFVTVYQGNTKWKLNEAIAFQKNGNNQQAQSSNKSENIGPASFKRKSEESGKSILPDNSKDVVLASASVATNNGKANPGLLTASESPIASEEIVARKEGTAANIPADNPSRAIDLSDDTGAGEVTSTDSVNKTTAVVKKDQPANLHLSPSAIHKSSIPDEKDDFQYRLQIAASKFKLSAARLRKLYSGDREIRAFKEDGLYKYYIEETSNYYVARQTRKESNVEHAFISAYKGDTKWPLQDAIALQYKVPEIESELAKADSVVKIVTVNFDLDEFVLPPDQVQHLRESVINELKINNAYHAIVNGYTDIRGSEEYNFGLSQERAFFVEQLIVKEGINSAKVTTQYFGESQVIKYCADHEHCDESVHQANRRVEILLLMDKEQ